MRVALIQMCSGRDVEANLERCRSLGRQAFEERGADWVLFPENAPFLGADAEKLEVSEPLDGPIVQAFGDLADGRGWVTLGSFPERLAPTAGQGRRDQKERSYNTQVMIAPCGDIHAVYRKLHLFDVEVEGGRSYRESDHVAPGEEVVVTEPPAPPVGLSICYDLRFPELYRRQVAAGAEILTVPSAFTLQTGRDHWHPLLQARAIENQCWVLAPNQWGHHFGDRWSYGHSAIYDPWGRRVACASAREGLVVADIDADYTHQVRRRMPVADHVRVDPDRDISTGAPPEESRDDG